MSLNAKELYDQLMNLVATNEAFYYKDFPLSSITNYRIFNYRLASYTDFLQPGALEARGIMFKVSEIQGFLEVTIVSRPMPKFFNLNENPLTMNLDLSKIRDVMVKEDGSLISTYIHHEFVNNKFERTFRLKTKASIESDQAIAAMKFLDREENKDFKSELLWLTLCGYTVNMEYTAPTNRVVIGYMQESLVILNIRHNITGEYLPRSALTQHGLEATLADKWVKSIPTDDPIAFVDSVPSQEGYEGVVAVLEDGTWVKVKTEWYLVQHRAKDSINSPRRLYEAVLEEATDDLRSLFHGDPLVLQRIADMELRVDKIYNHTVNHVESFYRENNHLERKEYAIKGQQEFDRKLFGLAMSKYLGKDPDYKAFMIKHYRDFGITDEEPITEE